MPKKSAKSKPVSTPGVRVVNPKASTVPTSTPTPFASLPEMQAVTPTMTPRSRQIVDGESVVIVKGRGI